MKGLTENSFRVEEFGHFPRRTSHGMKEYRLLFYSSL